MSELREFIADSQAEAVRRAAEFFGVGEASLQVMTPPPSFEVSGLEPRVLVIAWVVEKQEELGPVGGFVAGVLQRLGLQHPMVVREHVETGETIVRLHGRAGSWLRRQHGLEESLGHLAERIAQKEDPGARVRLEIELGDRSREGRRESRSREGGSRESGGREGRGRPRGRGATRTAEERSADLSPEQEERLEQQARAAAEAVRSSRESTLLVPMSSRERWVIHNVLKDEHGVRSESVGEGRNRRVKIAPA